MAHHAPTPQPAEMEIRKDQSAVAQAASPIATLSSHVDPAPFYVASAGCGGASFWLNKAFNNQRAAAAAAGFALLYLSAGRLVVTGSPRLGYDLGSATSLGLLAWSAPHASTNGAHMALATIGGMSAVANVVKSVQFRSGRPKEMVEH